MALANVFAIVRVYNSQRSFCNLYLMRQENPLTRIGNCKSAIVPTHTLTSAPYQDREGLRVLNVIDLSIRHLMIQLANSKLYKTNRHAQNVAQAIPCLVLQRVQTICLILNLNQRTSLYNENVFNFLTALMNCFCLSIGILKVENNAYLTTTVIISILAFKNCKSASIEKLKVDLLRETQSIEPCQAKLEALLSTRLLDIAKAIFKLN